MSELIGRKIVEFRRMTKEEAEEEGWDDRGAHGGPIPVLVLDDGTLLYPSQDEEGNGPGILFGVHNGKTVGYYPGEK
jgi:hypothetical protein